MIIRKIEALGRPRRPDAKPPRLPALSQPHHLAQVTRTTDSLFDYRDGIALLQHPRTPPCGRGRSEARPTRALG
jgi:hypothetical protein